MLSGYEHMSCRHQGMCLDLGIGLRVPVTQY